MRHQLPNIDVSSRSRSAPNSEMNSGLRPNQWYLTLDRITVTAELFIYVIEWKVIEWSHTPQLSNLIFKLPFLFSFYEKYVWSSWLVGWNPRASCHDLTKPNFLSPWQSDSPPYTFIFIHYNFQPPSWPSSSWPSWPSSSSSPSSPSSSPSAGEPGPAAAPIILYF